MRCDTERLAIRPTEGSTGTLLSVASVIWKGHLKRIHLEPGPRWLDVPLSACVSTGDQVNLANGEAWVICKNGVCQFLHPYAVPDLVHIGGIDLEVLVKEVSELDEHAAYKALADYHYRGHSIHGRTARLVVRTFRSGYPKVIGYVELATPFFVNKPRSAVLNAAFHCHGISWRRWDMNTLREYVHLVVRIARTVVAPEFRGTGIGQMLIRHAADFAARRWQVAGYLPYFLEISADMLKFVPFAKKAGMLYVGETEGNLGRVAKDMRYLIGRFGKDVKEKSKFEEISGILDQQVARMDRSLRLMEQEGMDVNDLFKRLQGLSQRTVLRQFALFHGIVSLPKPHFMIGLNSEASEFLNQRVRELGVSNGSVPPNINISPLSQPIKLRNLTLTYASRVRRTLRTHAVQQAFDISPDEVRTAVIRDLDLTIMPGEIVLVIGPSGSGKSTLLETIANYPKRHQSLEIAGLLDFPTNLKAATFNAARSRKPLIELIGERDVRSGLYLLGLAGLSEPALYLKRFQELSRGQQYRAMLANLIAERANLWIADEFCTNLDPATANIVANSIQAVARRVGAGIIAAAPHCNNFLFSLKPDTVVCLTSQWEYSVVSGTDYINEMAAHQSFDGHVPRLRVLPEMLESVKAGSKRSTVLKGRKVVKPELLLLSDGQQSIPVRVHSCICKRFSHLTDADALSEGLSEAESLKRVLKTINPEISDGNLVTVIHFEPLWKEAFPRGPASAAATRTV